MFCGATGVTKAHVFAKSWTELFDEPNDTREHEVVHHYVDPQTGERRELKRSKTFALVGRKVCGPCNSGWLRELEERLRPLMSKFAANTPVSIGHEEQSDLALWAVAATLIAMAQDPLATDFALPVIAHDIYRDRRPPESMNVWLGANSHGEMGWFGAHSLTLPGHPQQSEAWGASISFGYALVHLVFHGLPQQRMRLRGGALRMLRPIWQPRSGLRWPPPVVVRPHDLTPLAVLVAENSSFERAAPKRAK